MNRRLLASLLSSLAALPLTVMAVGASTAGQDRYAAAITDGILRFLGG